MKKEKPIEKEILVDHYERAGQLTVNELRCLRSIAEAQNNLQVARNALACAIEEAHRLPHGTAWRIMADGEIGLGE